MTRKARPLKSGQWQVQRRAHARAASASQTIGPMDELPICSAFHIEHDGTIRPKLDSGPGISGYMNLPATRTPHFLPSSALVRCPTERRSMRWPSTAFSLPGGRGLMAVDFGRETNLT